MDGRHLGKGGQCKLDPGYPPVRPMQQPSVGASLRGKRGNVCNVFVAEVFSSNLTSVEKFISNVQHVLQYLTFSKNITRIEQPYFPYSAVAGYFV